jgi:hypothetical protein
LTFQAFKVNAESHGLCWLVLLHRPKGRTLGQFRLESLGRLLVRVPSRWGLSHAKVHAVR